MLKEGTILNNRYRIEQLLAKGGMGLVYRATHIQLRKRVALKVMLPQFAGLSQKTMRFLKEAIGIADIHHRNIVDIMDSGFTTEGVPYFVMEYLEGETLKEKLRRQETLEPSATAEIMIQALRGLNILHARGILHRDVKPSNIFISSEEDGAMVIKLLDFGVAKFLSPVESWEGELTVVGSLVGTPAYMSPEQATRKKGTVDHRSDLYSCGITLYESIAGFNPFYDMNVEEIVHNIFYSNVPPPSSFVAGLAPEMDRIIMKAIEKDREKRYQDCGPFIDDLQIWLEKEKAVAPVGIPAGAVLEGDTATLEKRAGWALKIRHPPRAFAAVIVAVIIILAFLLWGAMSLLGRKTGSAADNKADTSAKTGKNDQPGGIVPSGTTDDCVDTPAAEASQAGATGKPSGYTSGLEKSKGEEGKKRKASAEQKKKWIKLTKEKYIIRDYPGE